MAEGRSVDMFQKVLDQVARTGERQEVESAEVPGVDAWKNLDSRGCVIWVDKGHWWVLPPAGVLERPAA